MGKSAGKWIKAILFGKKNTKSNLPKHVASDKKAPAEIMEDHTEIPVEFCEEGTERFGLEKDPSLSSSGIQGMDLPIYVPSVQVSDVEMSRQEEAATKAQAAFRGYLARRAFRALKGIIRLQALIRGHLVRRQAVATLRCMRAIVQLQALARGRMVRISEGGLGVLEEVLKLQDANPVDNALSSLLRFEKLAANAFIRKLLLSLPDAIPLALQYEITEPNSALQWLHRWSSSRFWVPLAGTKKNPNAKQPQRKQSGPQFVVEAEPVVKSKRTIRKAATNGDQNAFSSSFEAGSRTKRKLRTPANANQTRPTRDPPQTELERVKRNLRRVSLAAAAAAVEKPENSHPPQSVETVVSDLEIEDPDNSTEPINASHEAPHEAAENEPVSAPREAPISVEAENVPPSILEDDECCKENYQRTRKRNSLPAKHELAESVLQKDSPALPSYMAATKSAKARLRGHGSSKLGGEDGGERGYNSVRRHSLPALTQQATVQANGKRGSRSHRSSTASRDASSDKVLQPGWRR